MFWLLFFDGITFDTQKSTAHSREPPKSTTSSHVFTITKEIKDKKQIKKKIGLGSVVKTKVGDIEEKNREGRRRRTSK